MTVKTWKSNKLKITIEIDYDKCAGYGNCEIVCPTQVFEVVDGRATAPNVDDCIECCRCVEACPTSAITLNVC